jgi:hypothetical protein
MCVKRWSLCLLSSLTSKIAFLYCNVSSSFFRACPMPNTPSHRSLLLSDRDWQAVFFKLSVADRPTTLAGARPVPSRIGQHAWGNGQVLRACRTDASRSLSSLYTILHERINRPFGFITIMV